MGTLTVECVGGSHDGKAVCIHSSNDDFFNDDYRVWSIVVNSAKPINMKAFNNLKFTILTSHVKAAFFKEATIDVYYLQGDATSDPKDIYYKYTGELSKILENI